MEASHPPVTTATERLTSAPPPSGDVARSGLSDWSVCCSRTGSAGAAGGGERHDGGGCGAVQPGSVRRALPAARLPQRGLRRLRRARPRPAAARAASQVPKGGAGAVGRPMGGQRGLWRGVGSAGAPGPPQLRGCLGGSALRDPPVGCGDALGAARGSSGSWGPHGVQGSLLDPRGPVAVVSARGSGSVGHRVYGVSVGLWALCLWDPRGCMGFAGLWDPRSDPGPWGSDCAGALRGSGCWGSPCAPHPSAHGAPSTQ